MEKFLLQPSPSLHQLPLHALTFAFKDMYVLITFFSFFYFFSKLSYLFSFAFGFIHQFNNWVLPISSFEVFWVRAKLCAVKFIVRYSFWSLKFVFLCLYLCLCLSLLMFIYILKVCVQAYASIWGIVCDYLYYLEDFSCLWMCLCEPIDFSFSYWVLSIFFWSVCGYQYQQLGIFMWISIFCGCVLAFLFLNFLFGNRFDVEGYVTGFGNPDLARTHPAATSTAQPYW